MVKSNVVSLTIQAPSPPAQAAITVVPGAWSDTPPAWLTQAPSFQLNARIISATSKIVVSYANFPTLPGLDGIGDPVIVQPVVELEMWDWFHQTYVSIGSSRGSTGSVQGIPDYYLIDHVGGFGNYSLILKLSWTTYVASKAGSFVQQTVTAWIGGPSINMSLMVSVSIGPLFPGFTTSASEFYVNLDKPTLTVTDLGPVPGTALPTHKIAISLTSSIPWAGITVSLISPSPQFGIGSWSTDANGIAYANLSYQSGTLITMVAFTGTGYPISASGDLIAVQSPQVTIQF